MWQKKIPGCFGSKNLIFGSHHLDRCRAAELLLDLMNGNINWHDLEKETRDWLKSKFEERSQKSDSFDWVDANKHIDEQIKIMKPYFTPWITD